ncbi:MAG: FAD-dependent monooxygenase [Gemmataceae bacterium]
MRVLVIGGGIGGLAAALAVRQAGHTPAVFERAPDLREVGAGITLWTNAVKGLRRLDGWDAVQPHTTPLTRSELRTWDGRVISRADLGPLCDRLGAPTVGIHRADLQRGLAETLGADHLTLGAACVGFDQDAGGVTARFADGRTEHGDLLIGADGLKSAVRVQLHGQEKPRYSGYTAWRGVAVIDRPEVPLGVTLLAMGKGSQFGYLPIGGGRTYWFATANVPEGQLDPPGRTKAELLARFADWYAPVPAVIDATPEPAILRNDIVDRPPVRGWGTGRVTLLGDAAHPTTPNLGQGGCMAIEDAVVLGRHLAAADPAAGLRAYEAERYTRTATVTNSSRSLGRLFVLEGRLAFWARDTGLRLFAGAGLRQTEKLIGYEV